MNLPVSLDFTWLVLTMALTLRLSILFAMLPLLSGTTVPPLWRVAMAVVIAAAAAPAVAAQLPPGALVLTWEALAAEGLRSLAVGALLAFTAGIPFAAVRFAGELIGVQIGFSMVNTIDPQGMGQVSVLANLYYLLAVMIFFAVDGHHTLITVCAQSCVLVPPMQPISLEAGSWLVVSEFTGFFELGMRIAAPVAVVLLLVNVAMGFVVKTVPQINILVVGFPITIAVGLATLGLSLVFFGQVMGSALADLEARFGAVLGALQG
ncbi:MAG: flagellar biosynthetic protein FliR [Candidatus Latescibacteria bacterium]|nr:flagellar biosynthetic protein FliR [Candidatus Latescibacterota bacterium]